MLGIIKAIGTTLRAATRRPVTVQYPNEKKELPHRSRGFPVLLWDEKAHEPFCTGCQVCARYCPVDCMTVTMKDNPHHAEGTSKRKKIIDKFYIDYARCMRCDICVEVCNFDAIVMNNTWEGVELSKYDRQDLVMDLPALLRQHKTGDLADPFREPMGVAHSGWTPHVEAEEAEGKAATPTSGPAPAAGSATAASPGEGQTPAPGPGPTASIDSGTGPSASEEQAPAADPGPAAPTDAAPTASASEGQTTAAADPVPATLTDSATTAPASEGQAPPTDPGQATEGEA